MIIEVSQASLLRKSATGFHILFVELKMSRLATPGLGVNTTSVRMVKKNQSLQSLSPVVDVDQRSL